MSDKVLDVNETTTADEYITMLNGECYGYADIEDLSLGDLDKRKAAIDDMCVKLALERKLLAAAISQKCII